MKVKQLIICEYCAHQGIQMHAKVQKQEAVLPWNTRYGCENGHFFAVATKTVLIKEAA